MIFNIFLIYIQNVECETVLTSTHNLCYGSKLRIKLCSCIHPVLLLKWDIRGIHCMAIYASLIVFFCFVFLNSVLRPFQDYFSSYETGQLVGGAKTGEPREKTPDTPASRTWLVSHVARAGEPTPVIAVR